MNSGATASFSLVSTAGVELVERAANPHSRKWKRPHASLKMTTTGTGRACSYHSHHKAQKREKWPSDHSLSTQTHSILLSPRFGKCIHFPTSGTKSDLQMYMCCVHRAQGRRWGEISYPGSCKLTDISRTAAEAPSLTRREQSLTVPCLPCSRQSG